MTHTRATMASWAERVAVGGLLASAVVVSLGLALKESAVAIAIIAWLIHKSTAPRAALPSVAWPLGLWFLAGILSLAHTVDLHASLRGLLKMIKTIGIMLVAADCLRTKPRVQALAIAVLIGASLVSLDAFAQGVLGHDVWRHLPAGDAPGGLRRLTAGYSHANNLATNLISTLPVCLAVALGALSAAYRRWAWGLVAALGIILVLTFSRSGALGLGVGLALFCIARRAWKSLGGLAIAALVGWLLLPAPIRAWVTTQPSWIHVLAQPLRLEIWQAALNMIRAHPMFGVGVNTFVLNYARYNLPTDTLLSAYAHNQYLHMAAELGLVGLGAFLWLLVRTFGLWRRLLAHPDADMRLMAIGLGCGLAAFCTQGLLESALYAPRVVYVWLWIGALFGMAAGDPQSEAAPVCVARGITPRSTSAPVAVPRTMERS